jgi:hydrogenase maturation protein HypF
VDVLPDLAVCPDCGHEVSTRSARRHGYAFTNCTQCGPRYSIITGLPYDRPRTTMAGFEMCPDCQREYEDPGDRRFHAQPIACPKCGPALALLDRRFRAMRQPMAEPTLRSPLVTRHSSRDPNRVLAATAHAIAKGRIVAIKGIGGFHLVCDAGKGGAVRRMRSLKERDSKPLALMCPDISSARRLCIVNRTEAAALSTPAAPIVLLRRRPGAEVADGVAPGNAYLGIMLPYTPLHKLLFEELRRLGRPADALVATSANRRDDPIACTDRELRRFAVADMVLTHNRPIANRCDDSVVFIPPGALAPVVVRRSRGIAPESIRLSRTFHVKRPVLAVGADGRNAFAIAAGERVVMSPHIGSVEPGPGEAFFRAALARIEKWTGIAPETVVCDLHPDYWSGRLAEKLAAERGLRLVRAQHHYCHALSVMAEHGLSERVLAVVADGAGYGVDGGVWGCEFLLLEPDLSWQRVGHLKELLLSGASAELADPCLVAAEYLNQLDMADARRRLGLPGLPNSGPRVRASSLGRLFDAVAAITGSAAGRLSPARRRWRWRQQHSSLAT